MKTWTPTGRAILLSAIASAYPIVGYGAPAARVDFAVGNVTAVGAGGQSRTVGKGSTIEQGETVATNNGRAQLRFTDGAYVSLQPQSEFRIDQYKFDGKADGSEKGFFSLIKGGLRTITGLVGRSNKANYQVTTSVATIGIRGTEYTIQYGQSITGTVGEGEIEVCNGAGCLSVTNGESYYVQNQEFKPVLTNKRTDLPPPQPPNPPTNFTQGNNVDPGGNPAPGFALIGSLNLEYVQAIPNCPDCTNIFGGSGPMSFDSNGILVSFNGQPVSNVRMGGNDGFVAWGTFDSQTLTGAPTFNHFVVGTPVPASDITALGGTTGSYTLIGATPVTDGSNKMIGTLNSATLTVNFGAGGIGVSSQPVSAAMVWTINGAPLSAKLTGFGSGSTAFSVFSSGGCGPTCSIEAKGSLFGPNAIRAGMAYNFVDLNNNFLAIGTAALAKK